VDCWTCERAAVGACRFCGRGACREHVRSRALVVSLVRPRPAAEVQALVVEGALHCGVCRPRGEPAALPELDDAPSL
jgi:hypothetical protein